MFIVTSRNVLTFVATSANLPAMATSGLDLRLERVAARVKQLDLAKKMERDRRTVARYEGLQIVPDDAAAEYRAALATFRDVAEMPIEATA